MNPFKLFITLLVMSVVFVSCSKTELFEDETSKQETTSVNLIDGLQTGVLYVNQDALNSIGGQLEEVADKKIVYLSDEEFVKIIDRVESQTAKAQCGRRPSYSEDVWSGYVNLSLSKNGGTTTAQANVNGTINAKCKLSVNNNDRAMRIDAKLTANGVTLFYEQEKFPCDGYTIETPFISYSASNVIWQICSKQEFFNDYVNAQPLDPAGFTRISKTAAYSID